MIQINKNLNDVPSLLNSKETKEKRLEIIKNQCFPNKDNILQFSKSLSAYQYSYGTIKPKLEKLYHEKCCYCERQLSEIEKKIEPFEVEHFRPKSIYYWLAYSWDNLFLVCKQCNQHKSKQFETERNRVEFKEEDLQEIHQLAQKYDEQEIPLAFNIEQENPEEFLQFDKKGNIFSNNKRVAYMIKICDLNRPKLTEARQKIYKDFNDEMKKLYEKKQLKEIKNLIENLIENFKKNAENQENNFLAFRKFMLINWLKQKI